MMISYECFRGKRNWVKQETFKGRLIENIGQVLLYVGGDECNTPFPYELPFIFRHCIVTTKAIRITFPEGKKPLFQRNVLYMKTICISPTGPLREGKFEPLVEDDIPPLSNIDEYDSDV